MPRRSHLGRLLLVCTVAMGVAGTVEAQEPGPRDRAPATSATSATSDTIPPADEPVGPSEPAVAPVETDPPLDLLDQLVWSAGVLRMALGDRDYPAILVTAALHRALAEHGELALEGLDPLRQALALRTTGAVRLQRCRDMDDPVGGALCSLEELMPLAPPVLARELTEEGARLVHLYMRPGEPSLPQGSPFLSRLALPFGLALSTGEERSALRIGQDLMLDPFQRFAEETLEDVWRTRMQADDRADSFVTSLDEILADVVGFSPPERAEGILARVPDLQALLTEHPVVYGLREAARSPDTVLGEYHGFLDSVTRSFASLVSGAGALEDGVERLTEQVEDEGSKVLEWATQRSFVYLASRSAAFSGADAAVADRVRVLGNAAVDLRGGASGFSSNLTSVGLDIAMAMLGGNIFAVAANLTGFFEGAPGALGGGAASEVRELREGVETVRREIHERFDDVDDRFDSLLGVLDERFDRLEVLVASTGAGVSQELASLHDEVLALGRRLEHMEENLHSYLQAGFDRDYSRTLIRCLEHRERYLPPFDHMEFAVFSECLADFRARAVQDSRDALLTDQTTPIDDASMASALSDPSLHNLARRLTLLGRAAEVRFGYPGLQGGRGLANPVEWAVASQAYVALLQEWPEHARAVSSGDLEAMRSVGLVLRNVLERVTVDPSTGNRGELIHRVMRYYEDRVADLTAEADVLAHRHQQAELRRVPSETLLNRIEAENADRPSLDVPPRIAGDIPQEVRTAAILALGDAELVYRLALEDSVSTANRRRRMGIFGRLHDRRIHTRAVVEVELRFGDLNGIAWYRAAGPYVHRRTDEMQGDVGSDRVRSSTEHLHDPEVQLFQEFWPELAADSAAWVVSPASPTVVRTIEGRVEEELRRHATLALNNVFAAVCGEGDVPATLDNADRESAVRIRSALDGLSAARALIASYVRLGLPYSSESDPELYDALFGTTGVLDRRALCQVVEAGESPLRMVWLEEEPRTRYLALSTVLDGVIERDAEIPEVLPLVEVTLQQIEAAARVQRLRTMVARAQTMHVP